jgi:hypothetical protein
VCIELVNQLDELAMLVIDIRHAERKLLPPFYEGHGILLFSSLI